MKSIIILYFLFIILSYFNTVFSHSNRKTRLYDIISKSMNKKVDALLLEFQMYKSIHSTTISPINQQSNSIEGEDGIKIQKRDSWDSDEDHYFKWASLNRRPMESLVGKRSVETSRHGRINGGIWRSGLVG